MVSPDVQDSMMNTVKTQVQTQMRRTVNDSMMTTMKSGVWTTMRWTMYGTTKNVVCRHV
jgi:hypothetical protein